MKRYRVTTDVSAPDAFPQGGFDAYRVDAATEADIARHIAEDEVEAAQDAARYTREVRERLGLTQQKPADRINVLPDRPGSRHDIAQPQPPEARLSFPC